jgi:hypothetical protein
MSIFIRNTFRFLADALVKKVNAVSLDEIDKCGLIILADDIDSGAIILLTM